MSSKDRFQEATQIQFPSSFKHLKRFLLNIREWMVLVTEICIHFVSADSPLCGELEHWQSGQFRACPPSANRHTNDSKDFLLHAWKNILFRCSPLWVLGHAAGSAVGWGTALQVGRTRVRFRIVSLEILHWHNPSGRTMALGLTQHLTEISARNISWGVKGAGA